MQRDLLSDDKQKLPSDEELAELISGDSKPDGKRKKKPDPDLPSPRLPEAIYFYMFILGESAMLIGIWGFINLGPDVVAQGPDMEAPVFSQLTHHLWSMWHGLVVTVSERFWVPLICAAIGALVFYAETPRKRKRTATFISTANFVVFIMLIALQFKEDMAHASNMMP